MKRAPDGPLLEAEPGPAKKEPLGVGATEDGPLLVGPGPKREADEGERGGTAWIVSDEAGAWTALDTSVDAGAAWGTSGEAVTGAASGVSVDVGAGETSEVAGTTGTGSAWEGSEAGAEDLAVGSAGTEELVV